MIRKLVTVRRVSAISPIPGADRIETATIDGWHCVVQRNEFSSGDLGLFFEIDSFLPADDARWAHLAKMAVTVNGRRGIRIKTVRLRGQVSQGLLVPVAKFPEVTTRLLELKKEEGSEEAALAKLMDVAFEEALGVTKYDTSDTAVAGVHFYGDLPGWINKTDQFRCQNMPDLFEKWGDETFQETTKMDGSSMTVYFVRNDDPKAATLPPLAPSAGTAAASQVGEFENGRVGVCSKNKDLVDRQGNWFWEVAKSLDLPRKLAARGRNVAVQGELCGSSIQGNFEGFAAGEHDFYVYAVWDADAQVYLPPSEVEAWARELGLKHVPVVSYSRLRDVAKDMEQLLERADGTGIHGRKREGIVFKHVGGGFSFKVISNSYLLKHGG